MFSKESFNKELNKELLKIDTNNGEFSDFDTVTVLYQSPISMLWKNENKSNTNISQTKQRKIHE